MNISPVADQPGFHLIRADDSRRNVSPESSEQSSATADRVSIVATESPSAYEQRQLSREQKLAEIKSEATEQVRQQLADTSESDPAKVDKHAAAQESISLESQTLKLFNEQDVEAYQKQLMQELSSRGIDTDYPIELGFDYEGRVVVKNDHPDKAAIEAVFAEDPELRNGLVLTNTYFLFQELAALNEQWAEKIEAGVPEEVAGTWLVNAAKQATAKSGQGITFADGVMQDPFAKPNSVSIAIAAYKA